jgi:hypothetical protein
MPTRNGHSHAEAFMLMRYEGAGGRREWIWNSRDAITPFVVSAKDDPSIDMKHGNWHLDRYEPFHVPNVGDRVFVDLTEELARPRAIAYVERWWHHATMPMSEHDLFAELGKEGTVEHFVKNWVADWGGHAPHLITVTEALREQFAAQARDRRHRLAMWALQNPNRVDDSHPIG